MSVKDSDDSNDQGYRGVESEVEGKGRIVVSSLEEMRVRIGDIGENR